MGGRKLKVGIAVAFMVAGFVYAVLSSLKGPERVVYSYGVSQFVTKAASLNGIPTRVSGKVVPGSISRDSEAAQVRFRIADATGAEGVLSVLYPRMSTPDAFKDDAEVMLEGSYSGERGAYLARQLFTKCPSKYEAKVKEKAVGLPGRGERPRAEESVLPLKAPPAEGVPGARTLPGTDPS